MIRDDQRRWLQHTYPPLSRLLSLCFFGRALSAPRRPSTGKLEENADLVALVVPLQRRLMGQRLYTALWRTLLVAVLVASVTLLVAGVATAVPLPVTPLLTGTITVVIGLYAAAWAHPSPWQVAALLDRRLVLYEQITTTLTIDGQHTSLAGLLRTRTHDLLRTLDPTIALPRPSFRRESAVSIPLLVLFAVGLVVAAERPLSSSSHQGGLIATRETLHRRATPPRVASQTAKPLTLHFYTDPTSRPGGGGTKVPPPPGASIPATSSRSREPSPSTRGDAGRAPNHGSGRSTLTPNGSPTSVSDAKASPASAPTSEATRSTPASSGPAGHGSPTSPTRSPAAGRAATPTANNVGAPPAQHGSRGQKGGANRAQPSKQDSFSSLQQRIASVGAAGHAGTGHSSAPATALPSQSRAGGGKGPGGGHAGGHLSNGSSSSGRGRSGRGGSPQTRTAVGGTGHMPPGQTSGAAAGSGLPHDRRSSPAGRPGGKGVTVDGQPAAPPSAPFVLGQAAPGLWVGEGNNSGGLGAGAQSGTTATRTIEYLSPDSNAVVGPDRSIVRDYFMGQ